VSKRRSARKTVVVGAGVSGCACAAALIEAGFVVTLVDDALDHVGEPCFGPQLAVGSGATREARNVLEGLPDGLRDAWLGCVSASRDGTLMTIDRRMLSIETKRALERMPGLEFRQGLIVGLGAAEEHRSAANETDGPVWVETAFGEELRADAVVVAVGLNLGGTPRAGVGSAGRLRSGEPPSKGLKLALHNLGAEFVSSKAEIGPRFAVSDRVVCGEWPRVLGGVIKRLGGEPVGELLSVRLDRISRQVLDWGAEYPPSPYADEKLWPRVGIVARSAGGALCSVLCPDGLATDEMSASLEYQLGPGRDSEVTGSETQGLLAVSRPKSCVEGLAAVNVGRTGKLDLGLRRDAPVWFTGRAAGSSAYLESLTSGVRTGEAVGSFLLRADERID
jgi:hypothetical protein